MWDPWNTETGTAKNLRTKKTIGEHEQQNLLNTDNPNFDNELAKQR